MNSLGCLFARYERKLRDARENSSMWSSLFGPTIPTENFAKLCENVAPSLAVYEMDGAASTSWRLLTFFHSNWQASNVSRSDFKGKQQVDCCVKACKASHIFFLSSSPTLFFPPYIFSQCKTTANNISEWRGASHTNGAREREFMTFTERITEHHRTREMKTLMEFIAFCSWSGKWCLWCCKKNAQLFNHPNSIMSWVNSPFFFLILHIFNVNFIISFAFFQKRAGVEHLYDIDSRRRRVPGQRYSIKFTIVTRITRNGIVSTTRHALKCG